MKYDENKHRERFMSGIREHYAVPRMVERLKRQHGVVPHEAQQTPEPHMGEAKSESAKKYPDGHPAGCMCEECKEIRSGSEPMGAHEGDLSAEEMGELERTLGG